MDSEGLRKRTRQFALEIIRVTDALPRGRAADVIANQLLRAGTSVGANYRAACRAKSPADFASKMGTVEEEADECLYWMELLMESGLANGHQVRTLMREADELVAIAVASINTARRNSRGGKR
jgi:four helix bundle protein